MTILAILLLVIVYAMLDWRLRRLESRLLGPLK